MALRSKVGLQPLKSEIPTELFSLESLSSKSGCWEVLLLMCEGFLLLFWFEFFSFSVLVIQNSGPYFVKKLKEISGGFYSPDNRNVLLLV